MEKIIFDKYDHAIFSDTYEILSNAIYQAEWKEEEVPEEMRQVVNWLEDAINGKNKNIIFK